MPRWHLVLFSVFLIIAISSAKKPSESKSSFQSSSDSDSKSSSDSISQNSTCFLPNCRKCDILDLESCTCTPVFVKCAKGFIFDEETCNCIESSSDSSLCPGLSCPKDQNINEARCECTDKICQTFVPCPSNTILDLETCECICNLDPNMCPDYYIFDDFNCICRHPICDPPGPCPGSSHWDTELCQCKCIQRSCQENFTFDVTSCDCVSIYSSEPSKTEPETELTASPTGSHHNCDPPGPCPGLSSWNSNTCSCVCAVKVKCIDDYIFNEETCHCEPLSSSRESETRSNSSTELSTESATDPSSSCYIPECRWCDNFVEEQCICFKLYLDCGEGFMLDDEGCRCIPDPNYIPYSSHTYPVTDPSSSCSIPDCRWCDYMDVLNCECYRVAIDCLIGYELSSDGCTCIPISGFSYPSFGESSSETEGTIPTFPCSPTSPCPKTLFWNYETCSCECVQQIECDFNYQLSLRTCKCEPIYASTESSESSETSESSESLESSSISESSSSPCIIPDCRWCDFLDYENCVCHRIEFECLEGFQKSRDGCSCFSISNGNLTLPPSVHSSSPCFIESCRWCDIIDIENCTCQKAYVDCALGFELSSDGCSCVKSSSTSANCPGVFCNNGTYIDEKSCKCLSEISSTPTESSSDLSSSSSSFSNSSTSCSLPYCRSCDVLDAANCVCHKIVVDCSEGFKLSEDECSCEWVGLPSTSESSSESVSSTLGPCGPEGPPYCRWCDHYDAENCVCHMRYVDCYWGYELSPDGCTCIESSKTSEYCPGVFCDKGTFIDKNTCKCISNPSDSSSSSSSSNPSDSSSSSSSTNTSSSSEIPSSSNSSSSSSFSNTSSPIPCSLPFCKSCDILDEENCICHRRVVDCFQGYELSEDGCECVKSYSTSENCPGIYCKKGTYIDENSCQCINDACRFADPCPEHLIMDAQSCECFCPLNPSDCSFPYTFDYVNCRCRHPPCDPPGPCPNHLSWDPENCKCRCIQNQACDPNFIFDSKSCECVCDPKMMNTTCPSGSVFDSLLCDCIEEIDCYDFNDPECACECEEVLDCPPGKEFDLDYCDCLCPYYEVDPCPDGFMMSEETCECVEKYSK